MNSLLNVINRAFLVFLYLRSVWTAFIPSEGPQVIKFMDVWNKSYCRPIETLVEILQEYPDQVVYILKPACVPLLRCGGCCNDETLECVPTELHNVTMQIMKIKPHHAEHITEMHFAQHSKCVCRPKRESIKPPKSRCEPCTERRKHLFIQDQQTCICSCKITQLRCKSKGLELNVRSCRCTKPRR